MIKQANGSLGLEWLDRMSRMTSGLSDDTKIVAPELAVKHTNSIEVDGQQFVIHSLVPAHTNTDIMIEHKQSRTLFLGDNLFNGRLGRFDNSASILGNIKALEYALELEIDHHVPGHGQSGKVEVTQQYLDYLKQLQASVQEGFDNDMEDFEIKEEAFPKFGKYQNWVQFDDNFGRHVNSMYLEIEKSAW
jgi:glyoxylase-like metal-dependent hydrolase (beta-lactamase superfamily II)